MARLYQANLPVPEGFILTPHEAACLAAPDLAEIDTCHTLREMLKEAYRTLQERTGSPRVAVRSAGPMEDGKDTSYAGQYETFLNIDDEEALLQAVCSCALSGEPPFTVLSSSHANRGNHFARCDCATNDRG